MTRHAPDHPALKERMNNSHDCETGSRETCHPNKEKTCQLIAGEYPHSRPNLGNSRVYIKESLVNAL
jgi:hypothetical protein